MKTMRQKEFLIEEAQRHERNTDTILKWINSGLYKGIIKRKIIHCRKIFITTNGKQLASRAVREGEIPFKVWKINEAERQGIAVHTLTMRMYRGKTPRPETRSINKRVLWVKEGA